MNVGKWKEGSIAKTLKKSNFLIFLALNAILEFINERPVR